MRLSAASASVPVVSTTSRHEVSAHDTITHIALQYNTTPAELSRLNHLSTSLLYPGQSLLVPSLANLNEAADPNEEVVGSSSMLLDREKLVFSPDRHLDQLLSNTDVLNTSGDAVGRKYLKISKSKYVTDGHGVVSGVLLVTPQTVMFNPSVSDHLVMEHGQEMYIVRLPLRAISKIVVFEDIAAMVVGDTLKQYTPKPSFQEFAADRSFSPKPGHVVCHETGEPFALHATARKSSSEVVDGMFEVEKDEVFDTDETLENQVSTQPTIDDCTMTSTSSELAAAAESKDEDIEGSSSLGCEEFMEGNQLASTPKHIQPSQHETDATTTTTTTTTTTDAASLCLNQPVGGDTNDSMDAVVADCSDGNLIANAKTASEDDVKVDGDDLLKDATCNMNELLPSSDILTSEKVSDDTTCVSANMSGILIDESHFDMTPEMAVDVVDGDISHEAVSQEILIDTSLITTSTTAATTTKTKATVELEDTPLGRATTRKDSVDSKEASTNSTGSSLTDEARQWLGERGIRLPSDTEPPPHPQHHHHGSPDAVIEEQDVTPRLASIGDDPLMYVALKVHRTYFCPIRAKQNQIMGIPPNRDEKRREHWLAVPREKVDQFYNFLLYWSPDLCEESSACSTPCSISECENPDDKSLNRLDVPAASPLSKSKSLYSVSSRGSTCSLGYDELPDLKSETQLLSSKQVQLLTRKLPSRTVGHSWELIYSTTIHGISLSTLYRNCVSVDSPVLLVVQDESKKVFGAFLSEPPKVSDGFYGTGESMLFTFPSETKLLTFPWTGENQFFVKGSKTSFAIGGGEGVFGLWLDEDLYYGRSHSCKTFGNDMLSSSEDFICCGFEAWAFV